MTCMIHHPPVNLELRRKQGEGEDAAGAGGRQLVTDVSLAAGKGTLRIMATFLIARCHV